MARALILSDIHSNLEAFRAVLEDAAAKGGFDEVWCLGDTVGYGPDPRACIDLLREHKYIWVAGNHDLAAAGVLSTEDFNSNAAFSAHWTASQLQPEEAQFLSLLPHAMRKDDFTLVHGSLRVPIMEYLMSAEAAMATFQLLETRFCLVGHSHIPFICREGGYRYLFERFHEADPVPLGRERLIINPGGVGQPRDHDPRPSYAVYDSAEGTVQRNRVTYEIQVTQEKMRRAGLPDALILRLESGV